MMDFGIPTCIRSTELNHTHTNEQEDTKTRNERLPPDPAEILRLAGIRGGNGLPTGWSRYTENGDDARAGLDVTAKGWRS